MLATPVPTHGPLAERVLDAGKHCFVEKPLAQSVAEAERAVAAAERAGRVLMVGHLLEYHPGVAKLKEIAASGELGDIHYIYSNRLNLGKLRADENALWSLGAHDVSVVLHLAEEEPYELTARGESYMRPGIEDVVFGFMRFPSGLAAHLHLSWLDPHKERRFTVVGSRRMATFDDMDIERKVTVYDKGFDEMGGSSYGEYITRAGDIYSPRDPQPRAAAAGVRALRRVRARRARSPRSDGAARACASCGSSKGCRRRSTRRVGSRMQLSDLAPGLVIGEGVSLGEGVPHRRARRDPRRDRGRRRLRDPGRRGARQAAQARPATPPRRAATGKPLVLEAGAVVCCRAIVLAGARIGAGAILGDQSFVRERARDRGGERDRARERGRQRRRRSATRVRVQTDVYLTAYSVVEDDVFVGPGAVTTNDSTMARHGRDYALEGALLRRACRIGGAAVITPGVEVGEEAFVAAGAVVTRDVPARARRDGRPGRVVREVGDEDLIERWR